MGLRKGARGEDSGLDTCLGLPLERKGRGGERDISSGSLVHLHAIGTNR